MLISSLLLRSRMFWIMIRAKEKPDSKANIKDDFEPRIVGRILHCGTNETSLEAPSKHGQKFDDGKYLSYHCECLSDGESTF